MGNIKVVGDLPFAEYELEQFDTSSISIDSDKAGIKPAVIKNN